MMPLDGGCLELRRLTNILDGPEYQRLEPGDQVDFVLLMQDEVNRVVFSGGESISRCNDSMHDRIRQFTTVFRQAIADAAMQFSVSAEENR